MHTILKVVGEEDTLIFIITKNKDEVRNLIINLSNNKIIAEVLEEKDYSEYIDSLLYAYDLIGITVERITLEELVDYLIDSRVIEEVFYDTP